MNSVHNAAQAVLEVTGLSVGFAQRGTVLRAVDDISLHIAPGEVLGLVGESGSGKSMTAYSLLGLVELPGQVSADTFRLCGKEMRAADERAWRQLRGRRIAMIFQDPMMTLNPVLRIDTQMVEAIHAHRRVGRGAALEMAAAALQRVGIADAPARLHAYPHQLSGGMRQRVAIAIALLNAPDLIVADEPTTALDVTIQAQILAEMQALCQASGTALLWITHDLAVVAALADRVCVMYAGRIVEQGPVDQVLAQTAHPYTRGLLDSTPAAAPSQHADNAGATRRLSTIPGLPPALGERPEGCAFRPRCARASAACLQVPALVAVSPGHEVRCFHPLARVSA